MKELSIEEKAKRYDEAKARMTKAFNDNRCTIGFMNEIFPELAESEDERIRKVLKQYFEDYKTQEKLGVSSFFGVPTDKILAWLEKQCESDDISGRYKNNYGKNYVEQKPAWSEEDEDNIFNIIGALDILIQKEIEKEHNGDRNASPKYYNDLQDWLKSLKDRYTWKPSEEQMEVLLSEVTGWTKGCSKQIVLESLYQDLKKLKG